MDITVIKATQTEKTHLQVAAYCRVSTDSKEMESSIENQIEHYSSMIQDNPEYIFVGVYYDQGISGFKENRPGFQQMMHDARAGKMDLIITKSITRFARNTDTLLKATRELKELGIGVFFELQNINSLTQAGELLMTVHAAFAQGESETYRHLSRMAMRRRFEEGKPLYQLKQTLGYREGAQPDTFEIVSEEAAAIKQIFQWVCEEYTPETIVKMAKEKGFTRRSGKALTREDIYRMIKNEVYKGDYIMQKHFIGEDRKHRLNRGEMQAWYIEHDHPPIVTRKCWEEANAVIEKRQTEKMTHLNLLPMTEDNYPYKNRLYCGYCGQRLYYKKSTTGAQYLFFCNRKNKRTGERCRGISVPQKVVESWEEIGEALYITYDPDQPVPKQYTRYKESTWNKRNRKNKYFEPLPPYTELNYHYCKRIFCEKCGWPLYRSRRNDGTEIFNCGGRSIYGRSFCSGIIIPTEKLDRLPKREGFYILREEREDGEKHYSYTCRSEKPERKRKTDTSKKD